MVKVAAVQMQPALMDKAFNLDKINRFARQAADQGSQLAVFPECALTGYTLTKNEAASIAEPIPGPSSEALTELCSKLGMAIMVGTLETDDTGHLYNTAILIDPGGLRARYRKTHLPTLGVDRYVTPGDALAVPIDTAFGCAGMLICYDLRFPEPARVLALGGAQLILLSTAWPRAARLYPDFIVSARAAENHLYLVAANRIGEERGTTYLGRSIIADPNGHVLAQAEQNDETILFADIDPATSDLKHRVFEPGEYELDLFNDRRPDLYAPLGS
jgi:predicted amidohydrolase